MKINKVHCFFEQSGTFKNEFRKLGFERMTTTSKTSTDRLIT